MPDNKPSSAPRGLRLKPALKSSSPVDVNPIGSMSNTVGTLRFQCPKCKGVVVIEESEMGQPATCGNCGRAVLVPGSRTGRGSILGDFLIESEVGEGGMGTVFAAHQISLDRSAALKILHERYSQDPTYVTRFVREARAAAQLNHPNIVQAYAVGQEAGIIFFAMEYAKGSTLKQVLAHSGRLVVEQVLRIAQQIATGLDCAWQSKQLVHRDIKPDNVILTDDGIIKLADLGLARVQKDLLNDDSTEVFGTPQYIAPEQLMGKFTDNRSDIYSLGATLYHAVTGQYPFSGKSPGEIARKHLFERLVAPKDLKADVRQEVSDLICVMMAKRPGHRYQSAAELLVDIELAKAGKPISREVMECFQAALDIDHIDDELAAELPGENLSEAGEETLVNGRKLKLTFRQAAARKQRREALKAVEVEPPVLRRNDIASMQTTSLPGLSEAPEPVSPVWSAGFEQEPPVVQDKPRPQVKDETASPEETKTSKPRNGTAIVSPETSKAEDGKEEEESAPLPIPRPRLKEHKRDVPPGLSEAPDRQPQGKPGGKEERAEDGMHWLSAPIALVLVVVANVLTAMPIWRQAISERAMPTDELVVLAVFSVILSLLFFSRRPPIRILAGLLVFIMACSCVFVAFHNVLPSSWPIRMSQETLRQFAGPPFMLVAAFFLMGAFIANTGMRHVVQWAMMILFVMAGIAVPMMPESTLAGFGLERSLEIPGINPKTDFEGWTRLSMTPNLGRWQSEDKLAECIIGSWSLNAFESLDAFIADRRAELEERGFVSPAMFKTPGRDDQVQSVMFGNGSRVEFLAGLGEDMYYYIEFKTETTAYSMYHKVIRDFLDAVP